MPRSSTIPDKSRPLPQTLLFRILAVKQLGIGQGGLEALIFRYLDEEAFRFNFNTRQGEDDDRFAVAMQGVA